MRKRKLLRTKLLTTKDYRLMDLNIKAIRDARSCPPYMEDIDPDTRAAFVLYHQANPVIWKAFQKFAFEIQAAGHTRYSAKTIMERIRWEHDLKRTDKDFKINNDFTSLYARILTRKYPSIFAGFFELRTLKGLKRAA